MLLTNKKGIVTLVDIVIYPKVTFNEGIILVAKIRPSYSYSFMNKDYKIDHVFSIITN